jgi:hypothetical protein
MDVGGIGCASPITAGGVDRPSSPVCAGPIFGPHADPILFECKNLSGVSEQILLKDGGLMTLLKQNEFACPLGKKAAAHFEICHRSDQ